jgi:lipid-A-disaccharide synthase
VEKIRRSADHLLCIFPFEPELLARHGIASTYVGHPLANVIAQEPDRAMARQTLRLRDDETVVALLPGSRASEVQYLARRFFDAAVLMKKARPTLRFVLPAVPALRERIGQYAAASGLGDALMLLDGQSHTALAACDVTLIASGTATLEAALFKRPMVIAYNMNWLSWQIMRRKQLQPWVGLPNILSGEFVVPELLQDAATPQALARETLAWLDAPERCTRLQHRFSDLHHLLRRDTARLATDAIEKVLAG